MEVTHEVNVQVVDRNAGCEILDQAARQYLDISGAEFLRRWDAGEYAGKADTPKIMNVAMLIPLASA